MKSNKVINDYSKYKKVPTNIKTDLILDDNFISNHSKDDSHLTEAVSALNKLRKKKMQMQ